MSYPYAAINVFIAVFRASSLVKLFDSYYQTYKVNELDLQVDSRNVKRSHLAQ